MLLFPFIYEIDSHFKITFFFKGENHCISLAKMYQIHVGTSSKTRGLGLDRVA